MSGPSTRPTGSTSPTLANGFASCVDPARLQAICDRFSPGDIERFFRRWQAVIPMPFSDADRAAGYDYELSMRQVEVSRTIVFDDKRRARSFFESLVADNIGIERPAEVHAVFGRDRRGRTTQRPFSTRIFSPGPEVRMDFSYKHSRVKQYLKEGRALRIETVVNKPKDLAGPLPARASWRARRKGTSGQRPSAYDRESRPGLCHRLCAF
jgi:hypothetical protein